MNLDLSLLAVIISALVAFGGFLAALGGSVWFVSAALSDLKSDVKSLSKEVAKLQAYNTIPEMNVRMQHNEADIAENKREIASLQDQISELRISEIRGV